MTDRADRRLRRDKLIQMTINTGVVSGEFRCRGIVRSLMTRIAVDVGVRANAVRKSRIVLNRKKRRGTMRRRDI